jgi:CBS domain-containing protein
MAQQRTAGEAMTDAPTIGSEASLTDAARMMRDAEVAMIAVVDDGDTLIGVITDRDLAIAVVAEGIDAEGTSVGDVMSSPVSVDEGDSLDQAFQRMLDENVHRAPVTDGNRVSGMLSQNDAAREGEGRPVGGGDGAPA